MHNEKIPNNRVQRTRHKVSGPLTRDVGLGNIIMKIKYFLWLIAVLSTSPCVANATEVMPAWNRVNEDITFFERNGFVFEVADLSNKKIELIVVIPKEFEYKNLNNTFSSVLLLSDDIGVDVLTFPHKDKQRIIITISKAMAKKATLCFYYKNASKDVTSGTQFLINAASIAERIDKMKVQQSVPGYPPQGVGSPEP